MLSGRRFAWIKTQRFYRGTAGKWQIESAAGRADARVEGAFGGWRGPNPDIESRSPMAMDPKISEFVERARANGAPDQSIVGILAARGWPEKEVYEALAVHYERLTSLEIPRRGGGAGTAAKDAFFYLLIFSTLATWTIALGWLAFTFIDEWLPDTLFSGGYAQAYTMYNIAGAMASVLVSFPIYLIVQRTVIRDVARNPERLNSPVRKWLTYLALVCAAGVFIGDLITILTYLLRGEITSRFVSVLKRITIPAQIIANASVAARGTVGGFVNHNGGIFRQALTHGESGRACRIHLISKPVVGHRV